MGTSPYFLFTMVVFDELRITNDGEYLIIDVRIRKENIYSSVNITSIVVGTHKNYTEGESKGTTINFTSLNQYTDNNRHVLLRLSNYDLNPTATEGTKDYINLKKDLIYVYVDTTPLNTQCDLPCDMMQVHNIGATLYMSNIYNAFMQQMNEFNNKSCSNQVPQNLIDLILRYTALTTALDSKHFIKANDFYNKWFTDTDYNTFKSDCGCNG